MDYEDMIDEDSAEPTEPAPEDEFEDEFEDELQAKSLRTKSPWKAFILTGLLAGLIGAVGGGYGIYEGIKRLSPNATEESKSNLAPLEAKLKTLTNRLSDAETRLTESANRPIPEPKEVDLSGLEARLDALESAPSPEIDPAALTALQTAQEDGFEWPDTSELEKRLTALETVLDNPPATELPADLLSRLESLESTVTTIQSSAEEGTGFPSGFDAAQIDAFEARLNALESQPEPASRIERVSILAFPKAAMVAAIEDTQEGGFMKKALSKHVRVKDEDAPLTLIDAIEADISDGRLEDAAKKYDRLPEPVRAAGKAWYESVKASL